MKKTILLFILLSQSLFAMNDCTIVTFDKIIKINRTQDKNILKQSNCSAKIEDRFVSFIQSSEGHINTKKLGAYLSKGLDIKIKIKPATIDLFHIKEFIKKSIKNPLAQVKSLTSLYSQSSINLNNDQNIKIDCANCEKAGERNLSVSFQNQKIWLTTRISITREAFVLKKPINSLKQKLSAQFFQKKAISDNGKSLLFRDIENIRFYKFTRQIKEGEIVKKYDLTPRPLVQYGAKVKVHYNQNNIKVKTVGIAKQRGLIGDVINIINTKTKKVIQAKVIDFNQVRVEL